MVDVCFDDAIDGGVGDTIVGFSERVENLKSLGRAIVFRCQVDVDRSCRCLGGLHAGGDHRAKDRDGGFQIAGCKPGFQKGFVVMELEGMFAFVQDAEDFGRELRIAATGSCVQNVDAHARGRI